MNRRLLWGLAIFFIMSHISWAYEIKLRSERAIRAEVIKNDDGYYKVDITFVPVRSLNKISNQKMTAVVGNFLAMEALTTYLKRQVGINFEKTKSELLKQSTKLCVMRYWIPLTAILKVNQSTETNSLEYSLRRFNSSSSGLKDNVFQDFRSICFNDLRVAELLFYAEIQQTKNKAALKVAIQSAFESLRAKIEKEDSLFIAEKEDLQKKARTVELFLLKKLNTSSESTDAQRLCNNTLPVARPFFHPDFRPYLIKNQVLLEHGGCQVFKNNSGQLVLITVGTSAAMNNSPRGRILQRKKAEMRALAELAKYKSEKITTTAVYTESAILKYANKDENTTMSSSFDSKISVQAEAYAEKLVTVGYWYSKDEKLFFLAKGCFIPLRRE